MSRSRSLRHHRWFFALLRKVISEHQWWRDENELLDDLKDAVGHVDTPINPLTGKRTRRPRSMSFIAMDEDEFIRFRDRCLYVLKQRLGYNPVQLMEEIDATVGSTAADTQPEQQSECR